MLEFIEEKKNLSRRKSKFRFIYKLNGCLISTNLCENMLNSIYKQFENKNDAVGFCIYVANKTHYHNIRCNNINYTRDSNIKRHRMVKDKNLKITSWHKYETSGFYKQQ